LPAPGASVPNQSHRIQLWTERGAGGGRPQSTARVSTAGIASGSSVVAVAPGHSPRRRRRPMDRRGLGTRNALRLPDRRGAFGRGSASDLDPVSLPEPSRPPDASPHALDDPVASSIDASLGAPSSTPDTGPGLTEAAALDGRAPLCADTSRDEDTDAPRSSDPAGDVLFTGSVVTQRPAGQPFSFALITDSHISPREVEPGSLEAGDYMERT